MPSEQEAREVKEPKADANVLVREMRDAQSEAAQLSEIEELEYAQAQKLVESMKVLKGAWKQPLILGRSLSGNPSFTRDRR